jgi:hypothetical protein
MVLRLHRNGIINAKPFLALVREERKGDTKSRIINIALVIV